MIRDFHLSYFTAPAGRRLEVWDGIVLVKLGSRCAGPSREEGKSSHAIRAQFGSQAHFLPSIVSSE